MVESCGCIEQNMKKQMEVYLSACRNSDDSGSNSDKIRVTMDTVRRHGGVIITGADGSCKKTSFAKKLLLDLQSEGYDVIKVHSPTSIKLYLDPKRLQAFFIDGALGSGDVEYLPKELRDPRFIGYAIGPWMDLADEFNVYKHNGNTKFILTVCKSALDLMSRQIQNCKMLSDFMKIE